jgi:putative hydrolase of the HAD superfamily
MTVKAIVFDFGKVIGFFDHRRALERLRPYTRKTAEELYAAVYDGTLEDDYESGRITSAEFLRRLHEVGTFTCSDEVLAGHFADVFWPNQEVCDLVPRLKPRYRLVLGSNTNELHARHYVRQFADTLRHFDGLVLSHEVGVRKPKAGFFGHCVGRAGCRPAECVFVDDLPANVAGAEACGLRGVVYTGFGDLCQRLAALGVRLD